MGLIDFSATGKTVGNEISRATHIRRDLVLLTMSLLVIGLLMFKEWQRQVDAFHVSVKEYAESLRTSYSSNLE